jgi:hypothetical protein
MNDNSHYVCYVRDSSQSYNIAGDNGSNDVWLRMDDSRVERTNLPHVLSQKNAYMLVIIHITLLSLSYLIRGTKINGFFKDHLFDLFYHKRT